MQTIHDVETLRARVRAWRQAGRRIALVPTMGNLHDGHVRLVQDAVNIADEIVVSIFVNPLQFGQGEDFAAYPRTLEADRDYLGAVQASLTLFAPSVKVMYPDGLELPTRISVTPLSDRLCGLARPGHFEGVATVVAKLFNLVQPDVALFGRKDYQQLQVISRMVRDLNMAVEVKGVATVREADGLAMSSRNRYLSADQRARAPALYRALCMISERIQAGERNYATLEKIGCDQLAADGIEVEYLSIRSQGGLEPAHRDDFDLVILVAARFGHARLIDNLELRLNRPG
ncbi:MAG: pantoate--beta-alanine ligase [Aquisalimonadaceae bacterium]